MKICHVTMFAPSRCGLYEASRDMFLSDRYFGHDVYMVDVGTIKNGELLDEPKSGQKDIRANNEIITSDSNILNDMDIIIMHTGCNDNWIVKTQAPLIWVVHGRPLACYRPELNKNSKSYTLYSHVASWQRVKKMLYFWKEFYKDWSLIFNNKDLVIDYPVIDLGRFRKLESDFDFKNKGKYNFVVADSDREDVCNYEMIVSLVNALKSERLKDLDIKIHFYGLDFPLENCQNILLGKLKEIGKLGDIEGRVLEIEKAYNKAHCLISPNSIIVRTIAEAICCNCFIIANNCKVADINISMNNNFQMQNAIKDIIDRIDKNIKPDITNINKFSFDNYNKVINKVYRELI